jgi:cbb3-type cytochrome oxidase cytochrome c subunit
MNSGALVLLAAFFALASSWYGFVLMPQIQVGRDPQTKITGTADLYPQARSGLAQQGLEVYRANGCVSCHSQQVGQTATACEVELTDAGTNHAATVAMLAKLNPDFATTEIPQLLANLPKTILRLPSLDAADAMVKSLQTVGAKAQSRITPLGPDIARGWGRRRNVAEDYLYDNPVQLGSQRIGPDLANVGLRQPDPGWQLRHLYSPQAAVKGSTMPTYKFLFEERKLKPGQQPSPDAIPLTVAGVIFDRSKDIVGPVDREIVPKPEAKALAAYLLSLRADAPLFNAPLTPTTPASTAPPPTNAPAASASAK